MKEIYNVIRSLGITAKYKGYYFVADAIDIARKTDEEPLMITKDIYPPIARKYKASTKSVEHSIRTVVDVCWANRKQTLEELIGYPLDYKPTNSEFVDMLAYYLKQTSV